MYKYCKNITLFFVLLWSFSVFAQDALLVSFARIDHNGDLNHPEVELVWNVYQKVPGENAFTDYASDENLNFVLTIIDDEKMLEIPVTGNTYKIVSPKKKVKYECKVKIDEARHPNMIDITDRLNESDNKLYNQGNFSIEESSNPVEFPVLDAATGFIKDFVMYGKVLGISYILISLFILGLISITIYCFKLFKKQTWQKYILDKVGNFEKYMENEQALNDMKGPIKAIITAGIKKLEQYELKKILKSKEGITDKDSFKMYRVEKTMKDTSFNELSNLVDLQVGRMAGRTDKKVFDFLFSIEYFWNFGVIAPFLGLLGTVTGISKAFGTVSILSGLQSLKDILGNLSGGINEALYTTIGGLFVGILFTGFYYLFIWRIDNIHKTLDLACDTIVKKI